MKMLRYLPTLDSKGYFDLLRKFTLDELIMYVNNYSSLIFKSTDTEMSGVLKAELPLKKEGSNIITKKEVFVMSWMLIDLVYYAILNTHDNRGKKLDDENEFLLLVLANQDFHEKNEKTIIEHIKNKHYEFKFYLWCFAGEQFKFQTKGCDRYRVAREIYILLDISKRFNRQIAVEDVIKTEIGTDWIIVLSILEFILLTSLYSPNIYEYIDFITGDKKISMEEYDSVVDYYTADYEYIKNTNLKRQIFYSKPFVRTNKGEVLSTNVYLNSMIYEHALLWIVRNHYNRTNNQNFINDFGEWFESYFYEMLNTYIDAKNIIRIPTENIKSADWIITLGGYKIIIEQKSALLGLMAKQQIPDIKVINTFIERNIIKAIRQLHNTEVAYDLVKTPKIILLYDDYLKAEILDDVFEMECCDIDNDGYYWLVTIDEMEDLIALYSNNKDVFQDVMEDKINRELNKPLEGKSLTQLFNEHKIERGLYLRNEMINKYKKLIDDNIIQIIRQD